MHAASTVLVVVTPVAPAESVVVITYDVETLDDTNCAPPVGFHVICVGAEYVIVHGEDPLTTSVPEGYGNGVEPPAGELGHPELLVAAEVLAGAELLGAAEEGACEDWGPTTDDTLIGSDEYDEWETPVPVG